MIKVTKLSLNEMKQLAEVSLFSDTKDEVSTTPVQDIIGFPNGYTIAQGSTVMTADAEVGFMKSDGTWNWV